VTLTPLADVAPRERRVAIGVFDGVHLGHRAVIAGTDTVVTFHPHPSAVLTSRGAPPLLTTLERKAELVAEVGVPEMVVVPFTKELAAEPPEQFIDEVLVGTLGAVSVAVGENFRFGHRATGDPALLRADGRFETRVEPLLEVDGEIVSSSHIRGLLLGGAIDWANHLLGSNFVVEGEVVHGDERGRELGFPTANIVPPEGYVCPGHGVYACRTGDGRAAAVNVGVRPTFETGRGELIEAYVLDFDGDLYGAPLRVEFIARLRGERRFENADALIEQMHDDVRRTRELVEVG
jgi:riboflavin kinase / FMN adenylyltransferase